jgi:ribosomal protein S18 acetylase RimI-like enzyme
VTEISEGYQNYVIHDGPILFRPITEKDMDFLFHVYASTRLEEMAATGWDEDQVESFLIMQFKLQHSQYIQNYPGASFNLILAGYIPAGRLYVERKKDRLHIIDIALLPQFRRQGTGSNILKGLIEAADAMGRMMSLYVEMNNPILPYYRTLGLREIELRGIYYYMEREALKERVYA